MRTIDENRPKAAGCRCGCHHVTTTIAVRCCECWSKGHQDCGCNEGKRCCGDTQPQNPPDWPKPPGWQPGDRPATDPLGGATGPDDLRGKFNQAVIDIIRQGATPKGPHFGPRKNEFLPYLLIRAAPGDRGRRPLTIPCWESCDIFVAPDMTANAAPATPTTFAGVARAGAPNTLWAHVWNLGRSPVWNARVEFYWINPSLSISQQTGNLIGATYVDLGARDSGHAHKIVKCPETWYPTFVNGGHECLFAKIFEPLTDPLSDPWNANGDRHVGQRNIAVVNASSPAAIELPVRLGCGFPPGKAELLIQQVKPGECSWLSIMENKRKHGYRAATDVRTVAGFTHPTLVRPDGEKESFKGVDPRVATKLLKQRLKFERGCDELEVLFYVHVDGLKPKECAIFRLVQVIEGKQVGGYTVIARKQ